MINSLAHKSSLRHDHQSIHRVCVCLILLLVTVVSAPSRQVIQAPNAIPRTYSIHSGRPLADCLLQLQQAFLSPINYEEVAYESASELISKNIVTLKGPTTSRFTPIIDFVLTLTSAESTPYLAVHSAFSQYKAAGLYAANGYQVIQQENRIDVVPYQVLGVSGSWHQTMSVMSQLVTFPEGERTIENTFEIIASQLSLASGKKVNLLTQPFRFGEKVTLGASKETPGELIAKIGASVGATLSYQCLYDASDYSYYVNIYPVSATVTGNLVNDRTPGGNRPTRSQDRFFTKDVAK